MRRRLLAAREHSEGVGIETVRSSETDRTTPEEQIIDLIVAQTGAKRERIQLCSSLADDIGMDGDDAVEFFEQYGKRFGVDLTELHSRWDEYFLPEGSSLPLAFFFAVGIGVVAGDLLHSSVTWIPHWIASVVAVLVVYLVFAKAHESLTGGSVQRQIPILVHDLVEAAASGQWRPKPNLLDSRAGRV